jgi:hypothetical protein
MKSKMKRFFLMMSMMMVLGIMVLNCQNNQQKSAQTTQKATQQRSQQSNNDSLLIISRLTTFYKACITENAKDSVDFAIVDSLEAEYCTPEFISKKHDDDIDWDLLLNVQDYDLKWLNSLAVKKVSDQVYSVSYYSDYEKSTRTIQLKIQKSMESI